MYLHASLLLTKVSRKTPCRIERTIFGEKATVTGGDHPKLLVARLVAQDQQPFQLVSLIAE